ncbi:MAG: hypothetical protein ACKVWV_12405 [Planctomycetota bacterium]
MNFFCRLFGHTWVHRTENPKIRWTASENQCEMDLAAESEPQEFEECVRCKERRPYADQRRRAS